MLLLPCREHSLPKLFVFLLLTTFTFLMAVSFFNDTVVQAAKPLVLGM